MLRILHLSDFHLNKRTLRDWNDFTKEAFLKKIAELQKEKQIDFVLFTGDLVDKAGADFESLTEGFNLFKENIIEPILKELDIDISRFIICPGNHDVNKNKDDEVTEEGVRATLKTSDDVVKLISDRIENNSYKYIERIREYKQFEQMLYESITEDHNQGIFEFSIRFKIGDKKIGVSSLNTSWRCYGKNDFKSLLIGENQLQKNYQFIKDCDVKIVLMHHQIDWLSDIERRTISSHLYKNYDLIFSGHVHETDSNLSTGITGSSFTNVTTSGLNQIRSDSRLYNNGFTLVEYGQSIKCCYFKYSHNQKLYVRDNDIVDGGIKTYNKPNGTDPCEEQIMNTALNNIKEDHFKEMDDHFIHGNSQEENVNVKSTFVYPPIDDGESLYQEEKVKTSFEQIMKDNSHFLFLGPQESGKRSLLYRLIVEYIDEFSIYNKIPVFIDFLEIKNKDIATVIKNYTRLGSKDVKKLLETGRIVLLIDNLTYHESHGLDEQIRRLESFRKHNAEIRIIATYEHDNLEVVPSEIINHCKIPFSYHFIRGLRSKEIKKIMKNWSSGEDKNNSDEELEKLVNTFSSYHLPNNALSVNLYLWSTEYSNKKPINQAVLMEIYVELILEKLSTHNVYRKNFDFKNKIQLISMLAEYIVKSEKNNYSIPYSKFCELIQTYLKEKVGFQFEVDIITNYLLERKIFKKNSKNEVRFSHLCFLHFFIAKRMENNSDFKKYVLNEERYFNFPKEIDYYTGLVRSDIETFNLIFSRFKEVFEPMNFILDNVNPDEYFDKVVSNEKEAQEPVARNIEIAKIKESRPSDAAVEKHYDEQLDRISSPKGKLKGKDKVDFDRIMLIMCNVLRNSEGIENLSLKKEAYDEIIKHNLTYSILYTQALVRYIIENDKLPPSIPQDISIDLLFRNFPFHIQHSLYTHLGTQKLSSVILEKIKRDFKNKSITKTEIESYLSVALYSDVYGDRFELFLRKFIKSIKKVPTQNYMLYKLQGYLYKRSEPDSKNEEMYLDLISDLKIRSQKLPKRMKDSIIKDLKKKKEEVNRLLRLD